MTMLGLMEVSVSMTEEAFAKGEDNNVSTAKRHADGMGNEPLLALGSNKGTILHSLFLSM